MVVQLFINNMKNTILIISTISHLCCILPLMSYYRTFAWGYINVVILSVVFSILYHFCEESNRIINIIDYLLAGVWFSYDVYMGVKYGNGCDVVKIVLLNAASFIINIQIPYDLHYYMSHSIWHLVNSVKSYCVSCILVRKLNL